MKILLLFALFASALSFDFYDLAKAEWEAYKLEYGKKYESRAIDINQMSGFLQTKKTIAQHNQKYHRGEVSYKLGINELSDLLPHQYRTTRLGLKLPEDHQRSGYQFLSFGDYIQLPDSIDWRTLGAVTPPKNQGACGSCWAFSATGALEGQHFRKTGKLVSLSEQELIDCILRDFGCGGGLPDDAFRYIKQNGGLDTEESYPYLGRNSTCHFNQSNVGATDIGYVDIGHSELEIQQAVATVGPVSVAVFANMDTFMSYDGGIFDSPDCSHRIDHGVLIVGYGSENGVDYWIIKNSWGPNWGEGGYMRMVRGKNMCNIVTLASYPLV